MTDGSTTVSDINQLPVGTWTCQAEGEVLPPAVAAAPELHGVTKEGELVAPMSSRAVGQYCEVAGGKKYYRPIIRGGRSPLGFWQLTDRYGPPSQEMANEK